MNHCLQYYHSKTAFTQYEKILVLLHTYQEKEEAPFMHELIEIGMNEDTMSISSIKNLTQFLSFLSLHSKSTIDRLLKRIHEKGRELQNHVENLFTELFHNERITKEEIEIMIENDQFKEYIDKCCIANMIFLCEEFFQQKYHQPYHYSMKELNIPDYLILQEYSMDRCLMVIDLYNTKAIKKTIVKDFKKKVMKRKQIKRKYEEDDDYTESFVCF